MYRILVVDDEAKSRLLIRKYAECEGHAVTEAENGMEAVNLCRQNPDTVSYTHLDVYKRQMQSCAALCASAPQTPVKSREKRVFFQTTHIASVLIRPPERLIRPAVTPRVRNAKTPLILSLIHI